MSHSFWDYFSDPALRGPTIASMLMCGNAGALGVFLLLRRRSLIGEVLSHAAYPGVVATILVIATIDKPQLFPPLLILFSFASAALGIITLFALQKILHLSSDSALTLVLSVFFGTGIFLASLIQTRHALLFKQAQTYLFGQAATMTDAHITLYGILFLTTTLFIFLLYKELQITHFDPEFAVSIGIKRTPVEIGFLLLTALSIVVSMRSVGIVLMSGMLIAPAIAAKPWTERLSRRLLLAAGSGLLSGLFGIYLSLELPAWLQARGTPRFLLPTGPMILLLATALSLLGALFSPSQGLVPLLLRAASFRYRCLCENCLKVFWKEQLPLTTSTIKSHLHVSALTTQLLLLLLRYKHLVQSSNQTFRLTDKGHQAAERIVRLHRLWEVYLVNFLGQGAEKVHRTAEELEHMMTPELEAQLLELLKDYAYDPHQQPIPKPPHNR